MADTILETRKLADLAPMPKNTRNHSDAQLKEFMRSLSQFGQIRPIVIDEKGTIIVGHGLWMAMQKMGLEDAKCLVKPGLTEKQKIKLMLADNKIFTLGTEDFGRLDDLLRELQDFDIPGYDA